MKEKITIYTSETCHYCKQTKEFLKESEIDYVEKNIVNFKKEWEEVVDLLGTNMLPTILFKNNYYAPGRDYNSPQDLLNNLENITSKTKRSTERQILERLKTLNYGIHLAFRNVDSILKGLENTVNLLNQKKEEENEHESTS